MIGAGEFAFGRIVPQHAAVKFELGIEIARMVPIVGLKAALNHFAILFEGRMPKGAGH